MTSIIRDEFSLEYREFNADFSQRVVIHPSDKQWGETQMSGVRFQLLEACCLPYPRRTLVLDCKPGSVINKHDSQMEVEFFVLDGEIADENGNYPKGTYVRNPNGSSHAHSKLGCRLFVKLSQIHEEDQGQRVINTKRESKWLPGPVEGTEIYPLHMWDCESVFLIRWLSEASFKPTLNPDGEEIYVVHGQLNDKQGTYPKGSWIRNPPVSWQSWEADNGTIVYYKHGHFPDSSEATPTSTTST